MSKANVTYNIYQTLDSGDQAELRRGVMGEPFWRIIDNLNETRSSVDDIKRWSSFIQFVTKTGYSEEISFGKALYEANVSKSRVKRLLRSKGDNLIDLLRRISQRFSSNDQKTNWDSVYWLIFGSESSKERARINISREYFTKLDDNS